MVIRKTVSSLKRKTDYLYHCLKADIENYITIFKNSRILVQKTQKFLQGEEEWIEIEKAKGAVNFFFIM
jgi:hypothetical protein